MGGKIISWINKLLSNIQDRWNAAVSFQSHFEFFQYISLLNTYT